ncbi:MAG: hypothetical protein JWR80_8196 [Bradyrhizobium sp.]|nr:hypothetical protein [Bradyrhizobium sp.]
MLQVLTTIKKRGRDAAMLRTLTPILVPFLLTWQAPAMAQATPQGAATPYTERFVTAHQGVFNGQKVTYTATVDSTVLNDAAGRPAINFVSTAYVRRNVRDPAARPVIFVWGGGPSGPSTGLEMRLLGPRLSTVPPLGQEKGFTPTLVDNPQSVLDAADLVFVDPAETGFTRVLAGGRRAEFYSVDGDAKSIADFIGVWLKANGREASTRYILGQSYGSVRAIKVAIELAKTRPVDGIIVQGNSAMTLEANRVGSIVAYAINLPTFAVEAAAHGLIDRAGRTDAQIVDQAYEFATKDYLPALARVQDLSETRKREVATRLSALTGVPVDEWISKDLALSPADFRAFVTRAIRAAPDHSDIRRTTALADPVDAAFARYMANELGVTYPMAEFRNFAPDSDQTWNFGPPNRFSGNDWPGMLRDYLKANPKARYLSMNGLHDGIVAVGSVRFLFSRTALPRDRAMQREYPGGHSSYTVTETRSAELADIRAFVLGMRL